MIDLWIYRISRFIFIFSAAFTFPTLGYVMINPNVWGLWCLLVMVCGWGFGWIVQDMYKPLDGSQGGGMLPGG